MFIEEVDINSIEIEYVKYFLNKFNLSYDKDIDHTIVLKHNGEIIGTVSSSKKVIKCFAVDERFQGIGIAAELLTYITNLLFDLGIYETFIFTKTKNVSIFMGLGYRELCRGEDISFLEGGRANIESYTNAMFKKSGLLNGKKAALVMNCNPFTLGHRYIVEKAAAENEEVVLFIVEEDMSVFPFDVRMSLVKKGVCDLKNVAVLPGGEYIISKSTFPTYFIKQEDERLYSYTRLDAYLFGRYIAPVFNIKKRYVGTEDNCNVTNNYNQALMEVLPPLGVDVELIDRLYIDGEIVSASRVRKAIKEGNISDIKKFVPDSTYDLLNTKKGAEIIKRIKGKD